MLAVSRSVFVFFLDLTGGKSRHYELAKLMCRFRVIFVIEK